MATPTTDFAVDDVVYVGDGKIHWEIDAIHDDVADLHSGMTRRRKFGVPLGLLVPFQRRPAHTPGPLTGSL